VIKSAFVNQVKRRSFAMRERVRLVVMLALFLVVPSAVFAQASIAGLVRDSSQAVLPGVTVEASSPALIEKVRSVVTDATGQYRIVDLRPGTYTVTFTLPGFSTVKREGIELTGTFVATVNVELRVGALEETITVTGETPVVDVQSARSQQVLDSEIISAIPTARNYQNLHMLVPAVSVGAGNQDVGGAGGDRQIYFQAHGGEVRDSRVQQDGLMIGVPQAGGGRTMFVPNAATAEEVGITTSGGLGESETAGVVVNMIPKQGGNVFSGMVFATGATEGMVGNNFSDELQRAGLRAPNKVKNVFDYNGTLGGPVVRDRLWFFYQARYNGNANYIAGMFVNRNAGDPTKWNFDPDFNQQIVADSYWVTNGLRLTWQASPRNKLSVSWEDQIRCVGCTQSGSATSTSEASGKSTTRPNVLAQTTWTSPLTNRILLEAGFSAYRHFWGSVPRPDEFHPDLIRVTDQGGIIPGLNYRAQNSTAKQWAATYSSRASITYTSGSHSMKFGYNGSFYDVQARQFSTNGLSYRFNNGVPNQLTQNIHPFEYWSNPFQRGFYGQDQWSLRRLTLAGGIRYDMFSASFSEGTLGPTRFLPAVVTLPAQTTSNLKDITLRGSATYDVFGDGRTALKVSLGKYVTAQDSTSAPLGSVTAPMNRIPLNTTRSWNDANRNFIPDCDLANPGANGECGARANQNFGSPVFSNTYDPEVLEGWGVRPYNWAFDVQVQRELLPRVSMSVGYFRRWFGNFVVTDNRATTANDYTRFNLPVPADPRLPVSGTITGFASVNPTAFGQVDNFVTRASNYGDQTQRWNGVDVTINARMQDVTFQGGASTGRDSTNNCEIVEQLPEIALDTPLQYCDVTGAFVTNFKFLVSYTIPRVEVQVAATLQNIPGEEMVANWATPNAVIAPVLGRPLAGNAANQTLQLLPPKEHFSDRTNQLDIRFAKLLRVSGRRIQVALDLYNALNSNTIQNYNASYNPTGAWRTPTGILPSRVVKVSGQVDF
jgi:hypothetical protein